MVPVANRSRLRHALETTSGTVTSFLEQLVGERIDARAHHHSLIAAPASNELDAKAGEPLLQRAATLLGRTSGSSYVYAETVMVVSRLPEMFRVRLESSSDPIGRILDEMGIKVTRENLAEADDLVGSRPNGASNLGEHLLTRTYRIDSDQTPVMVVSEWFLKTLQPFLSST